MCVDLINKIFNSPTLKMVSLRNLSILDFLKCKLQLPFTLQLFKMRTKGHNFICTRSCMQHFFNHYQIKISDRYSRLNQGGEGGLTPNMKPIHGLKVWTSIKKVTHSCMRYGVIGVSLFSFRKFLFVGTPWKNFSPLTRWRKRHSKGGKSRRTKKFPLISETEVV